MKYEDYRDKIKSGDLIVFTTNEFTWRGAGAYIIRLFTMSDWYHVGLVVKISGRLFLIEAVVPEVRLVPLSHFKKKGFAHIPLKKAMSSAEMEFCLNVIGKKYSRMDCVRAFFGKLTLGENDYLQCAELAAHSRKYSGVDLGEMFTPSGIVEHLLENGYTLNYVEGIS